MIHTVGEFTAADSQIARFLDFCGRFDINPPLTEAGESEAHCSVLGCNDVAIINNGSLNFCGLCFGSTLEVVNASEHTNAHAHALNPNDCASTCPYRTKRKSVRLSLPWRIRRTRWSFSKEAWNTYPHTVHGLKWWARDVRLSWSGF